MPAPISPRRATPEPSADRNEPVWPFEYLLHRAGRQSGVGFLSCRGIAQPGRAPALGAGGRGFESLCPDQYLSLGLRASLRWNFLDPGCRLQRMKMRREPARTAIAATTEKSAPRGARRSSPFSHPHTSTKVEGAQTTARTRRYSSMKPGMRAVVLGRPSIRSAARAEKPVKSASILSRSTATVGKRRDRTTRHASRPNKRSKQLGCKAQPQGGQTRSGRAHGASQVSAPTRPTTMRWPALPSWHRSGARSSTPFTLSSRSTNSMTATGAESP